VDTMARLTQTYRGLGMVVVGGSRKHLPQRNVGVTGPSVTKVDEVDG
jgi:hypothetical protein